MKDNGKHKPRPPHERKKGLLRLFILRTTSEEPKSGYDILREIEGKSPGEWHPSKGTIYPILGDLEKEGLITAVEEGARSRRAYRTTEAGITHLQDVVTRHRAEHRTRMAGRRLLFEETFFDETERRVLRLWRKLLDLALASTDKKRAMKILQAALRELEGGT